MKRMHVIAVLALVMAIGFFLRAYNLNFPSIGYHNMKENEYLSMAEAMAKQKDYIARRVYFYNAFDENPSMRIYPQVPLISYQIIMAWRVFGENLWGPRLINVVFGVLAIAVIYFIALLLFEKPAWALCCSFMLAVMPLGVFFSRNLQPESPAFFWMLLGAL